MSQLIKHTDLTDNNRFARIMDETNRLLQTKFGINLVPDDRPDVKASDILPTIIGAFATVTAKLDGNGVELFRRNYFTEDGTLAETIVVSMFEHELDRNTRLVEFNLSD